MPDEFNESSNATNKTDPYEAEKNGLINYSIIKNDYSRRSLYLLTQLKIIFQRQLPKMPREYIARLIYDPRHESILLLSNTNLTQAPAQNIKSNSEIHNITFENLNKTESDGCSKATTALDKNANNATSPIEIRDDSYLHSFVIGGITMRLFGPDVPFLEIVFCAISSTEQVRGYGAFLMNILKSWVILTYPHIRYFLTYADNYAVGYFKKQGFSRQITLDRSIWSGLIKDYDGGTLMECHLLPGITDYRSIRALLIDQKAALMNAIKSKNLNPFIKHAGISHFPMDPHSIPGLEGRSWKTTPQLLPSQSSLIKDTLSSLLVDLQTHHSAWPFLEPVKITDVPDYLTVVKHPMDLKTIGTKVFSDHYRSFESFISDVQLIFDNCRSYNQEHTPYYKCANVLECFFKEKIRDL